jgi:hypothetical protein
MTLTQALHNLQPCVLLLGGLAIAWWFLQGLCPFLRTAVLQGWDSRPGRVTVIGSLAFASALGVAWSPLFLAGYCLGALPFVALMLNADYDCDRWGIRRPRLAMLLFMIPYASGLALCFLGVNTMGVGCMSSLVLGMLPAFSNFSQAERKMGVDE